MSKPLHNHDSASSHSYGPVSLLVWVFAFLLLSPLAQAQFGSSDNGLSLEEPDFLPVDEAYVLTTSVEGSTLVLHWDIAEGYYLYKNRTSLKSEQEGVAQGEWQFSQEGKQKEDPYFGLVTVFYDDLEVRVPLQTGGLQEVEFTVGYQGCADAGLCYPPQKRPALYVASDNTAEKSLPAQQSAGAMTSGGSNSASGSASTTAISFLTAIFFAFVGGLILNLMPCVFPVLSLKALKLARVSGKDKREHQMQAIAYTAGVVSLFSIVAFTLISLRAGGESIGWGFQLQSPWFVGLMVYLLFILGLSLSGVIEIGTSLMGAGDELTTKGGKRGAFFTGALAVLVASPCTAPFMGSAMGYAMTQPPAVSISVFISLGLGMAMPFLLIAFIPAVARLLPKPGAWMNTFKQVLAFPMYLSSLWLLWVLGRQTSVNGMTWVLGGLIAIAFACWLYQRSRSASGSLRTGQRLLAACSAVLALSVLTSPAQTEQPVPRTGFDETRISQLTQTGQTVFVNVTADWCVSCLVNENTVLSQSPVAEALSSEQIAYIKGDWTNSDPAITDYLATFGRNGVPLYVVYKPGQQPQVLPQILTKNRVMEALGL